VNPFGKRAGNQGGLVVAALALPIAVERHWNYDVSRQRISFVAHQFSKAFRKPCAQRLDLLEFQKQNRLHQRGFINREAPRSVKRVRFVATGRTKQGLPLLLGKSGQRPATDFAAGLWNVLKSGEAFLTNGNAARIDKEFVADAAARRKYHADQRIAGFGKPDTHTPPPKFQVFAVRGFGE
jgi:hypothetical protein